MVAPSGCLSSNAAHSTKILLVSLPRQADSRLISSEIKLFMCARMWWVRCARLL